MEEDSTDKKDGPVFREEMAPQRQQEPLRSSLVNPGAGGVGGLAFPQPSPAGTNYPWNDGTG